MYSDKSYDNSTNNKNLNTDQISSNTDTKSTKDKEESSHHHKKEKEKYPDKKLLENLEDNYISEEELDRVKSGFKINHLKMKDGDNGIVMWDTSNFDLDENDKHEDLPKELLDCKVVVREVNFSSIEKIADLELIQNFYLYGELIESARFYFGFVIPNSTNNWEQVVEAKSPEEMLSYEELSGNLVVEILFLTKGELIVRNRIVINYV